MMINETVILLSPLEDCSKHRLSKHMGKNLGFVTGFDYYFYQPLQEIFSRVIPYDFETRLMEIGVRGLNEEIIALVRKEHPKYAIWVAWGDYYEIQESTLATIRQEGTIVVGFFFDDEVNFDRYSKFWIPYLDYVVTCATPYTEIVSKYKALGARVIPTMLNTGIASNVDWSNIKEKYDVSFVGKINPEREHYINEIRKKNIGIQVFGSGWGGFIPYEEMIDIYKTSKINLNFSTIMGIKQRKGRVFEVCLAGGFLLTEHFPGIENDFELDKEIVCFHDTEEMIDKITYYLSHETERRAIAQAGWKRASSEYTTFHILSRVFGEIEKDFSARGARGHLQEIKKPRRVRQRISSFYLRWAIAFSMENYKGLGREHIVLSLRHYPFNTLAWYHYIISFLPFPLRVAIIRLYRALYHRINKQGKR